MTIETRIYVADPTLWDKGLLLLHFLYITLEPKLSRYIPENSNLNLQILGSLCDSGQSL